MNNKDELLAFDENELYENNINFILEHIGVGHEDGGASGRYPWGSGGHGFQRPKDFYSFVRNRMNKGLTEIEIATGLGMSTTSLRAYYRLSRSMSRKEIIDNVKQLSQKTDPETNELYSLKKIGEIVGSEYNNGKPYEVRQVKTFLNEENEMKANAAINTANFLMQQVDQKGMIDVGIMVDKQLNVSREKLNSAIAICKDKGYVLLYGSVEQQTNPGKIINYRVLAPKGTKESAAYDYSNIHSVTEFYSPDKGQTFRPAFEYPSSLKGERIMIRYAEEGGLEKDGTMEIRRGVKDLSLGSSLYSQVRILVDDKYYAKGMAVYSDGKDMPDGVDIIFNTNKALGTPKEKVLKSIEDNIKKDPANPFGTLIKEKGGQSYYDDPNGKYIDPITGNKQSLSLINKRADVGDWMVWKKDLSSQFLSKQPVSLISKQLQKAINDKEDEFKEIENITNPTVKATLLNDFANDCDKAAADLKASAITGARYHVILPSTTLKDNEIYAPNFKNGSEVALVRFPHAGTFEIPLLKVNNNHEESINIIGSSATDAVCINSKVARQLSGADFDGDTVLVIPTNINGVKIKSTPAIASLENFDVNIYGPDKDGIIKNEVTGETRYFRQGIEYKPITPQTEQKQMGSISNLITDMTLQGATIDEKVRAVKHSMVVIDSNKHHLDYKQSELDNGIEELKQKYQKKANGTFGGASTLISQAKSPDRVPKRAPGKYLLDQPDNPDNGNELILIDPFKKIYLDEQTNKTYGQKDKKTVLYDPDTGEKLYRNTNEVYLKVKVLDDNNKLISVNGYINVDGKYIIPKINPKATEKIYYKKNNVFVPVTDEKVERKLVMEEVRKMYLTNNAQTLSSGTIQEQLYVNYANKLKAMANKARKEYLYYDAHPIPYSKENKQKYIEEFVSLEKKVGMAELNAPKERAAQLMAAAIVKEQLNSYADEDKLTNEEIRKLKQNKLVEARLKYNAKNMRFNVTDQEWEAIQNGAFTLSRLKDILRYADKDRIRDLATPKNIPILTKSKQNRIEMYARMGYTTNEIASRLGISYSTVNDYLQKKEGE